MYVRIFIDEHYFRSRLTRARSRYLFRVDLGNVSSLEILRMQNLQLQNRNRRSSFLYSDTKLRFREIDTAVFNVESIEPKVRSTIFRVDLYFLQHQITILKHKIHFPRRTSLSLNIV